MQAVIDQELHFCENTVNEHAKLLCCTSQMELLLKEFKLRMVQAQRKTWGCWSRAG